MTKKKGPGRPKPEEPKVAFQLRLPASLNAAVEESCSQARRPKNTEIEIAIEEYLTRKGLWPPPSQDAD